MVLGHLVSGSASFRTWKCAGSLWSFQVPAQINLSTRSVVSWRFHRYQWHWQRTRALHLSTGTLRRLWVHAIARIGNLHRRLCVDTHMQGLLVWAEDWVRHGFSSPLPPTAPTAALYIYIYIYILSVCQWFRRENLPAHVLVLILKAKLCLLLFAFQCKCLLWLQHHLLYKRPHSLSWNKAIVVYDIM